MRFSRLISVIICFAACRSPYAHLQQARPDTGCLEKFRPEFKSELYNTQVDVLNRHLSGLLLVKTMPDSSTRILFSSEMGLKFFDFEFSQKGAFVVHAVIKQMNRKAVIQTLRKDFEAVLMKQTLAEPLRILNGDSALVFIYPAGKEYFYYITSPACGRLERIEIASKHKIKVAITTEPGHDGTPDSINITHKNFRFNIALKKLQR